MKPEECANCKIVCNGKEVAQIECGKDGLVIKCTEEGKKLCRGFKKNCW